MSAGRVKKNAFLEHVGRDMSGRDAGSPGRRAAADAHQNLVNNLFRHPSASHEPVNGFGSAQHAMNCVAE